MGPLFGPLGAEREEGWGIYKDLNQNKLCDCKMIILVYDTPVIQKNTPVKQI